MAVLNRKLLYVCLALMCVDEVDRGVGVRRDVGSMTSKTVHRARMIQKKVFVITLLFPTS